MIRCGNAGSFDNPDYGHRAKKPLAERVHHRPNCGLVLDRDINAAINIEQVNGRWTTATPSRGSMQGCPLKREDPCVARESGSGGNPPTASW
ncbi:MAG: zinc ribbon domain-containing protein [Candidatus Odinarchaeota archaeon]